MYENIPTTPYFAHRYPGYQLNRGFRTSKSFYFFLAEDWWTLVYTHPLFTPYPIPLHPSEFNSSVLNVYLVETIPSRPKPLLRFAKFGDNEANLPYYNRPPLWYSFRLHLDISEYNTIYHTNTIYQIPFLSLSIYTHARTHTSIHIHTHPHARTRTHRHMNGVVIELHTIVQLIDVPLTITITARSLSNHYRNWSTTPDKLPSHTPPLQHSYPIYILYLQKRVHLLGTTNHELKMLMSDTDRGLGNIFRKKYLRNFPLE